MRSLGSCRIAPGFLAFLLVLLFIMPVRSEAAYAEASSLARRKIVSLVYDDSSSMLREVAVGEQSASRAVLANYALQSFVALLNSQDMLFITYMNAPEASVPYRLNGDRAALLRELRQRWQPNGSTPYRSVETALKTLTAQPSGDPNDEYWLVIITDGAFNYVGGSSASLTQNLSALTQKTMPNGTLPRIAYFAIGDSAERPDSACAAAIYPADSSGDITAEGIADTFHQIADSISGRTRVAVACDDSLTVYRFSSPLELYSFHILTQQNDAVLISAREAGQAAELQIASQYSFYPAPEAVPALNPLALRGNAAQCVGVDGGVIPAGEYELTFSKPVEPKQIVVMIEPAIKLAFTFSQDGKPLESPSSVCVDERLSVACTPLQAGSEQPLDQSVFERPSTYRLDYRANGALRQSTDKPAMTLDALVLEEGRAVFDAMFTLDGYAPVSASVAFTPQPRYTATAQALTSDTMTRLELSQNKEYAQSLLAQEEKQEELSCASAVFTPLELKKTMTGEEILASRLRWTVAGDTSAKLSFDASVNENGQLIITPFYEGWNFLSPALWRWTASWVLPPEMELTITLWDGQRELANAVLYVRREPWPLLLLNMGLPVLFLTLLAGYLFKRRFSHGAKLYTLSASYRDHSLHSGATAWTEHSLTRPTLYSFLPFVHNRFRYQGVLFTPGKAGFIQADTRTLIKGCFHCKQREISALAPYRQSAAPDEIRPVQFLGTDPSVKRHVDLLFQNDVLAYPTGAGGALLFLYQKK